jgi:hypothetical protein
MIRTRVLDQGSDVIISDAVLDLQDELGFSAEEMIPGLIYAATLLAEKTFDPEGALDDASNLLAETGRV